MGKQVAVIGLGRFGASVVETLAKRGCEILAIDKTEENVKAVTGYATHAGSPFLMARTPSRKFL